MESHLPPSEEGELWRDAVGYEGLYMVSSHGRVWSVPRMVRNGRRETKYGGKVLSAPVLHRRNCHYVRISDADHRPRLWLVSNLVALAFIGPRPEGLDVLHGPRRNTDGSYCEWLDNLSYGTKSKNNGEDKHRDGTQSAAKLKEDDVREIRRLYWSTRHLRRGDLARWTLKRLGEKFGVDQETIRAIVHRRTWVYL